MSIERAIRQVEVFIVNGREFYDEESAKEYEKTLEIYRGTPFLEIHHEPDLAEGRGFQRLTVVAVDLSEGGAAKAITSATQYCLDTFGSPIVDFYGRPYDRWSIQPVKVEIRNQGELGQFMEDLRRQNSVGPWIKATLGPLMISRSGKVVREMA